MIRLIRKKILTVFCGVFLVNFSAGVLFPAEVSTKVGEFDSVGDNQTGGDGSFGQPIGANNVGTYTAEGSAGSRPLSSDLTYTFGGNGEDWTAYQGKNLGFYIYNNSSSPPPDLTITIKEEDEQPGCTHFPSCTTVTETWTVTVTTIDWTNRWGYLIIPIDGTNFTASGGGNGNLDTAITNPAPDGATIIKGVTEFKFAANANLYIDRIIICDASDVNIDSGKIFPPVISENITAVNLDNKISTISVGLGGTTNTPEEADSRLYLVTAAAPNTPIGTYTYSDTGDYSLYLTPPALLNSGVTYMMFIRPVDTAGHVGMCHAYSFTLNLGYTYEVPSVSFQRELTN